jgi:Xaa-Pro dipeptidase
MIKKEIFEERVEKFQKILQEKGIDLAVIRTLSTFIYFTGTKWLRPSLLIPAEGDPFVIVAKGEAEYFKKRSWIEDVREYDRVEKLMFIVTQWIRQNKVQRVGMEDTVERDSFVFFHNMFKMLNPKVELVDILMDVMNIRMVKSEWEIQQIKEAGKIAKEAMKFAGTLIRPDVSETEIAGELYHFLYKHGCEEPLVYVAAYPRLHAEPLSGFKVEEGRFVSIVLGVDYNYYYVNNSRNFFVGKPEGRAKDAIEAMEKAYKHALQRTRPGEKLLEIEKEIQEIYKEYSLGDYYMMGYTHGTGLLIEELPMTTIIAVTRKLPIKENMVMSFIHSPLMLPEGAVKLEDTIIIGKEENEVVT